MTRELARVIIEMRRTLLLVAVARARGQEDQARRFLRELDGLAKLLPLTLQRDAALDRLVSQPAQRRLDRVGILTLAVELNAEVQR